MTIALNDANFLIRLRQALSTQPYLLSLHAKQRIVQRKVSSSQVLACLKHGYVCEQAHLDIHGNWKATIEYVTGGDCVQVVAAIKKNDKGDLIVIVTVIL